MAKYMKTEEGYQEIEIINSNKMDMNNPVGTGSFSMGRRAGSVVGLFSHAEGNSTTASGHASHAEGNSTTASGNSSHAEGVNTTASGLFSHAEGADTAASGHASHAEGKGTTANGQSQHIQGEYNIVETNVSTDTRGKYVHIVGNGTKDSARSNAHTLDWNGNAWFAGDVYVGSTSGTNKDDGSKKLATEDYVNNNVDATLTQPGQAADAAEVGARLSSLSEEIANIPSGKDGVDGITPTIGDNGNWYLGETDTGKPSRGEPGQDGADGKDGAPGAAGADGHTPVKGTDYFTAADKQEIAEAAAGMVSIPDKLPNPNALTFTGAVTGIYDGSEEKTINIPSGGGSADRKWALIKTLNVSTDVAQEYFDTDDEGDSFSVQEILIEGTAPDIGTGYLYCRPSIAGNVGNTQIWPTKGKYFKWYIGIYNNLLKTTLAISNNAIVGPLEKNVSCPERITGLTIGSSSGYNEAVTIYVYGR